MTTDEAIDEFRLRLTSRLGPDATLEIIPSREPGRFNLWVVAPDAAGIVEDTLAQMPPEFENCVASLQAYDTAEEAGRLGVRLGASVALRPDWLSRLHSDSERLDEDPVFDAPLVVAFYSFRGGVGRTTALAHTAALLAKRGRRVVVVDADLEAPGLHHAFGVSPVAARSAKPFVDLLGQLASGTEQAASIDIRDFVVQVDGFENLYLLPSGEADAEYLALLDGLTMRSWTLSDRNPVRDAIEAVVASALAPDVVMIDARTGLTDSNALFLLGACDHVVVVFYPSEQSRSGTELVTTTLPRGLGRRGRPVGVHFVASPIPAGPGAAADTRLVERAKEWATSWASTGNGTGDVQDPDFLAVPYVEALALSDRITLDVALTEPYETIADWIDPVESAGEEIHDPGTIRSELRFTAGNSDVPDEDIQALFVRTEDADRISDDKILLVEGRKGTGKTTLFRWLLDEDGAVAITAPEALRTGVWWPTRDVWKRLAELDSGYRLTWPALIGLRAAEAVEEVREGSPEAASMLLIAQSSGVGGLVRVVEDLLKTEAPAIAALDLMVRALLVMPNGKRLIFDGLDTAFGYALEDRELRDAAIGSLLPLLMDREATLPAARFTVFLRTDIVRGISFANQSHLFGRRLTLAWAKEDYLKTVLKQALTTSPAFARETGARPDEIDSMTDDRTLQVWYALIGVRVRGKQTAFTDRWVWSRLADGHGDHSPRHVAQLFRVLADRARTRGEESGPPLRARDLGAALSEVVSQEALTAVQDEFASEVKIVLPVFQNLEQSPFSRKEWTLAGGDQTMLALAETMGLIAAHPRDPDRLIVPELYRYALDVRRRGPA